MTKKFQLLVRIWVKQTPLYNTATEAYEVGRKIAKEEDITVEEVEENDNG